VPDVLAPRDEAGRGTAPAGQGPPCPREASRAPVARGCRSASGTRRPA